MFSASLALLPLLPALLSSADACPTVATGTPNELTYDVARTAIVRQGNRTTFTVSINPQGNQQSMALVMPVPGMLAEDDIRTIDAGVFERLEGQTGILTMEDAGCATPDFGYDHPCPDYDADAGDDGSDGAGGEDGSYGSVEVEAEYLIGDYLITLLSAEESGDLFRWLNDHGYHLAEATIPALQDYIDEGMYFLAAEVSPEATAADGTPLPPLQVTYESEVFAIPIKLAAASSPGQQDMLIYALTEPAAGQVGISNYRPLDLEDQCIWNAEGSGMTDFGAFYEDRFDTAWRAAGGAGWSVEWAGESWYCNPCSGYQIYDTDLGELGYEGDWEHFLTRLHVRYTPETANQDLVLYESGIRESTVTTFAMDNAQNQWCILPCDESLHDEALADRQRRLEEGQEEAREWVEQMEETCDDEERQGGLFELLFGSAASDGDSSKGGGCSTVPAGAGILALLIGLVTAGLRRNQPAAGPPHSY